MRNPNKPPPLGFFSRAAGGDNDQVENDKKNIFFSCFLPSTIILFIKICSISPLVVTVYDTIGAGWSMSD